MEKKVLSFHEFFKNKGKHESFNKRYDFETEEEEEKEEETEKIVLS